MGKGGARGLTKRDRRRNARAREIAERRRTKKQNASVETRDYNCMEWLTSSPCFTFAILGGGKSHCGFAPPPPAREEEERGMKGTTLSSSSSWSSSSWTLPVVPVLPLPNAGLSELGPAFAAFRKS